MKKSLEPEPDAWEAGAWLPGRQKREYQARSFIRGRRGRHPRERLNSLHRGPDDEGHWPAGAQRISVGLAAQAESPSIAQLTEGRAGRTLWSPRDGLPPSPVR